MHGHSTKYRTVNCVRLLPLRSTLSLQSTMNAYNYRPLSGNDSIRVLELLPGQFGDRLQARLLEVRLLEDPTFAALSYCWGEPKFDTLLECDDQALYITSSLAAALSRLRYGTQPLIIWADQVCINQNDNLERSAQVMLMGQIYTKAEKVLIWLGEDDSGSIPGLQIVERLSRAQLERDRNGDTRNKHQLLMSGFSEYGLPKPDDTAYTSFSKIFQRPWFSRGWILQEAVLAKEATIHCGRFSFEFHDYYRALVCCFSLGFNNDVHSDDVMRFTSLFTMKLALERGRKDELLTLLFQTRSTITTDPKDKIYCLLGLARDAESLKIQPNYNDSCSFKDVYRETAIVIIQTYGNLDVLSVPKFNRNDSLPSWVPDWRPGRSSYMLSLTARERTKTHNYRAAGDSKADIQLSEDRKLLGLQGYCVDQIVECGEVYGFEENTTEQSLLQQLREGFHFGLSLRLRYMDWQYIAGVHTRGNYTLGGTKEDAFWRTLTAGYPFDTNTDFKQVKHDYRAWHSKLLRFGSLRSWVPHPILVALVVLKIVWDGLRTLVALTLFLPLYDRSQEPFNEMAQCVSERKIFRTKKGFIGLAPQSIKEGDSVALFEGGMLPLIIRQSQDNWVIFGDCYVHGMMNGELFDVNDCRLKWIQ
jgi:hypothetical protein